MVLKTTLTNTSVMLPQVTNNTKALMALDQLLLERLSANTGNLLDDEELIGEHRENTISCSSLLRVILRVPRSISLLRARGR